MIQIAALKHSYSSWLYLSNHLWASQSPDLHTEITVKLKGVCTTDIMCYLWCCKSPLSACSDRWEGSLLLLNDHLDHMQRKHQNSSTELCDDKTSCSYICMLPSCCSSLLLWTRIRGVEQTFSLSSKHQFAVVLIQRAEWTQDSCELGHVHNYYSMESQSVTRTRNILWMFSSAFQISAHIYDKQNGSSWTHTQSKTVSNHQFHANSLYTATGDGTEIIKTGEYSLFVCVLFLFVASASF